MGSRLFASCTTVLVLGVAPSTWLCSADARGEIITFRFEGTLEEVRPRAWPQLDVDEWPAIGTPIVGTYRFDLDAPDTAASTVEYRGRTEPPLGRIDVSIGEFEWVFNGTGIRGFDSTESGTESYNVGSLQKARLASNPSISTDVGRAFFSLMIVGNKSLQSLPLTASPPNLDFATDATIAVVVDPLPGQTVADGRLFLLGRLNSLVRVPEPGSVVLVFLWALFSCARRPSIQLPPRSAVSK